jgi:hypothetical protein
MLPITVAPMRGRGFHRGINAGRGDMFRSRPPNTSRPPSMHVDDYVKMEMQQGQSGNTSTSMPPPSLPPPMGQARRMDVCMPKNLSMFVFAETFKSLMMRAIIGHVRTCRQ